MKTQITATDYAQHITECLSKGGILLNTNGDKFNTMVIGWGGIGRVWNVPTFTVFVRENRYTKAQLDKTRTFTISIPEGDPDQAINQICGLKSGKDIDKVKEAGLTLEEAEVNGTPGIREYPITLECKVLYAQKQDLSLLPVDIREKMYPQDVDSSAPLANRDPHTMYVGQIVAAYKIG